MNAYNIAKYYYYYIAKFIFLENYIYKNEFNKSRFNNSSLGKLYYNITT